MRYEKTPLSIFEQIKLLRSRKLVIEDENRAAKYLKIVGYYRLSGYMYHLQSNNDGNKFKDGTTFDDVIYTYQFDKKLRYLLAEYIERIEVAMRTLLTDEFSLVHGFFWYKESKFYIPAVPLDDLVKKRLEEDGRKPDRKYVDMHSYIMKCVKEYHSNSTDLFLTKFKQKYTESYPPSNMAMQILTMGKLSKLFASLKKCNEAQKVAETFRLPIHTLSSWLIYLTNVRNICAHHSRLWNRRITADQFAIPYREKYKFNGELPENFNRTVYGTLSVMIRLLDEINPQNGLLNKFKVLIAEYPKINLRYMGFPDDWEVNPAWARPEAANTVKNNVFLSKEN